MAAGGGRWSRVVVLAVLLLGGLAAAPLLMAESTATARAHENVVPVRIGTSFSPRRAQYLGLDYQSAFRRVEGMGFRVIRLPAYWSEIDSAGYAQLDWLMAEAGHAHQPVILTVGMKSLDWPEFYIPERLVPAGQADGADVAAGSELRSAALDFVVKTVERYRANPELVAWQVENEPFNPAGPHRWWIDPEFLKKEVAAVRRLDPRPLIVNAFTHFDAAIDQASSRSGWSLGSLLGFNSDTAEADSLAALRRGDILGLDVYTHIGFNVLGHNSVALASSDWADRAGGWHSRAASERKAAWITEAQAEPWEPSDATLGRPISFGPQDLVTTFGSLKQEGFGTVLLWGCEYWLWQQEKGNSAWIEAAAGLLHQERQAPSMAPAGAVSG